MINKERLSIRIAPRKHRKIMTARQTFPGPVEGVPRIRTVDDCHRSIDDLLVFSIDPATKDVVDPASKICSPVFREASNGGMVVTQSAEGTEWNVARVRRSRDMEHPGWNTVDVIVDGDRAVYLVNGKVVNRCTKMCRPDPNDPQHTVPLTRGRILLQAEGAEVLYRNIEIKDLSDLEWSLLGPKP
jgi:hypothetical protein